MHSLPLNHALTSLWRSYIDKDILFLSNRDDFLCEFMAACVWGDSGGSLEITNSAFCLAPQYLHSLKVRQLRHRFIIWDHLSRIFQLDTPSTRAVGYTMTHPCML